jgi:hypothetical protein
MQNNILTDTKEIEVSIKNYQGFADSSPVGTFVFSILCFAFWAADLNLLHEGGQLAIGLLQFGVFITYMIVGSSLIQKGNGLGGNTYLLFGTVFGAIGGFFNTFGPLFAKWGIPFDYSLFGLALIMAGIYLFLVLPGLKYAPKVDFLVFFFGGVGVLGSGLTIMGFLPASFNIINGWALFFDGVAGFYSVMATVLSFVGVTIPCGKPFFSQKKTMARDVNL